MINLTEIRKHIINSAVATSIAEVATIPIATIKTNYQNTDRIPARVIIRNIWAQHGLRGFYNSSGWAMASQVLSTSAKYTWYQTLTDYVPNKFVAGGMAGVMASIMTHPVDVIKIHQQMHTPFLPQLKLIGPSILYRGYSKTLAKYIIGSIFYFPLYDTFTNYMHPNMAAMTSAVLSTILIQPIDYMKIRQVYGQPFFSGWNPHPYFKGLSLNLIRAVPHFTITMGMIEYFRQSKNN
jgi:hypothetical protein